jgi:hypothetical protein
MRPIHPFAYTVDACYYVTPLVDGRMTCTSEEEGYGAIACCHDDPSVADTAEPTQGTCALSICADDPTGTPPKTIGVDGKPIDGRNATYREASLECHAHGMRLCLPDELKGCCGCGQDLQHRLTGVHRLTWTEGLCNPALGPHSPQLIALMALLLLLSLLSSLVACWNSRRCADACGLLWAGAREACNLLFWGYTQLHDDAPPRKGRKGSGSFAAAAAFGLGSAAEEKYHDKNWRSSPSPSRAPHSHGDGHRPSKAMLEYELAKKEREFLEVKEQLQSLSVQERASPAAQLHNMAVVTPGSKIEAYAKTLGALTPLALEPWNSSTHVPTPKPYSAESKRQYPGGAVAEVFDLENEFLLGKRPSPEKHTGPSTPGKGPRTPTAKPGSPKSVSSVSVASPSGSSAAGSPSSVPMKPGKARDKVKAQLRFAREQLQLATQAVLSARRSIAEYKFSEYDFFGDRGQILPTDSVRASPSTK